MHRYAHLHQRQQYVGHWQDLPLVAEPGCFTFTPQSCSTPGCCGHFSGDPCKLQALDYITHDGVIAMNRAAFACQCGAVVWQSPIDFLRVGAWPASLDPNHLRTIVDCALLQHYDSLRLQCPGLSLAGFLKGTADAAHKRRPSQARRAINPAAFSRASHEFKACQLDMRLHLQSLNDLEQAVKCTLDALDLATHNQRTVADKVCRGIWTAAGNSNSGRHAKQDITGRVVATDARHGGPLLAANMIKSGERYGYAFGLALELMQRPGGLAQLHLDIMCKWEPWQRRVMAALANWDGPMDGLVAELRDRVSPLSGSFDEMRKVLSYAHGTLHAMNCQVLYQPSWIGYGKTLGEEGEQFFSYWSKHAATTRNQSRAGSTDALTEAAAHFGREKNWRQAALLARRHTEYSKRLVTAQAKLSELMGNMDKTPDSARPAFVQLLKQRLQAVAKRDCSGRPHWEKKLMQLFALARCIEDAQALSGYVSAGGTYAATAAASPEQREYQQRLEACRIVAGMHDADAVALHNLALKVIKAADMDRFARLAADLAQHVTELRNISSIDARTVSVAVFQQAAEVCIINMQNTIEGLCHNLQKQAAKRAATAARPKERRRYDAKCKELAKQLEQKVAQYNKLLPYGQLPGRAQTIMSDLRSQRFCWVEEYAGDDADPLRVYGVARSLEVCEADNEVCRLQEELPLLLKEMKAHLKYWQRQVDQQQQVERVLLDVASKVRDADAEAAAAAAAAAATATDDAAAGDAAAAGGGAAAGAGGVAAAAAAAASGGDAAAAASAAGGDAAAAAAAAAAATAAQRYAADDACWDEVGSEDEVWVPSDGGEDAESVDTVEQVD
ncbi:hypothetical protein OEZ86_005078 [Tetradesmus obliquus]|nr:hypothetical protein OEZ86_005078 [Tetradesmus obliquus]